MDSRGVMETPVYHSHIHQLIHTLPYMYTVNACVQCQRTHSVINYLIFRDPRNVYWPVVPICWGGLIVCSIIYFLQPRLFSKHCAKEQTKVFWKDG